MIRESQPQAVPYAAASSDPALTEESVTGQVDQGVEQGLATAATTEIADIAYSHSSQPDASSQLIQQDTSAVLPGPTDVEQQDHPGLNVQEASQVVHLNTACRCCDGLITHCICLVGIKAKIIYLWAAGRQRSVLLKSIAWGIEAPVVLHLQDNTSASQIAPNALKMQGLLSLDSQKRNNIHPLGTSKVLTSAGTNVIVLDLTTSLPEYIATPIQGGIGALTASADGRYAPNAYCLSQMPMHREAYFCSMTCNHILIGNSIISNVLSAYPDQCSQLPCFISTLQPKVLRGTCILAFDSQGNCYYQYL